MIKRWGGRVFTTVCFGTISKGILLWLASVGVYPDRWIAAIIEYATAMHIPLAAQWMLLGVAGLAGTICWERFGFEPRIKRATSFLLKDRKADDWMALHEAARLAYERTRGSTWSEMAETPIGSEQRTPADILNWYAYSFIRFGVPVYGQRPPSTVRELIPTTAILQLQFTNGARSLVRPQGTQPLYTDLAINHGRFKQYLIDVAKEIEDNPRISWG
jgi:hypothetical protein